MPQSRRSFLATLGAAAIATVTSPPAAALPRRALDRVGLQLYTVRSLMRQSVETTLEAVARIGYREVEFAGYFEHAPSRIAALLAQHGLTAPSTHIGFDEMRTDWARVLDGANAAGHTWVTVPSIPAAARGTLDDWRRIADLFNERAAQARAAGLRFAYHNHDFEFASSDGAVPYDVLLSGTEPGLVGFELDVYWASRAGFDPVRLLEAHPQRFVMTHLKDSAGAPEHRMADVGSGILEFPSILRAAAQNGVQHHFVEHDRPDDALRSVRASYQYLRRI